MSTVTAHIDHAWAAIQLAAGIPATTVSSAMKETRIIRAYKENAALARKIASLLELPRASNHRTKDSNKLRYI